MLSKPEYGWTTVKLGRFQGRASYLTDVANDCLDAFIYAIQNKVPAVVYFDSEEWDFHLVSSYYDSYIIADKDKTRVYKTRRDYIELAKELVHDIESNINEWAEWGCPDDSEEYEENKKALEQKLDVLKRLIEKSTKN